MMRIFELKEYNDERTFKLAILKMNGNASLWYENLKMIRATEAKSKVKTWFKLKKNMDKKFLQARALPQGHYSQLRESQGGRT